MKRRTPQVGDRIIIPGRALGAGLIHEIEEGTARVMWETFGDKLCDYPVAWIGSGDPGTARYLDEWRAEWANAVQMSVASLSVQK